MCPMKSGKSWKDCKGAAVSEKCYICRQCCILFFQKLRVSRVAVGEVCIFDGMVLRG